VGFRVLGFGFQVQSVGCRVYPGVHSVFWPRSPHSASSWHLQTGSYLRLIDSCITQLKAQGPSRTCNESDEERRWHPGLPGRGRHLHASTCFRVSGFRVSGFRVQVAGFRVQGAGFRVQGAGFRAQGAGFRVQGSGFGVGVLGFGVGV